MSGASGQGSEGTPNDAKSVISQAVKLTADVLADDVSRKNDDRSWIARRMMVIFTIVVALVIMFNLIRGFQTGQWDKAAEAIAEVLKTTMLPIVTLVLGYYFGQSSK